MRLTEEAYIATNESTDQRESFYTLNWETAKMIVRTSVQNVPA